MSILEKVLEQAVEHRCKGLKAIIMDYQMPIMNGEDATRIIIGMCKDRAVQVIPIFGLTGFSGESEINCLIEAGMKEVFVKPITLKMLEELLANLNRGEYRSFDYVSNLSQQFHCIEIDYGDQSGLVNN